MKLYHPHLADVTVDVDDAKVDDWTEQGWRKSAPKPFVPSTKGTVIKTEK